MKSLIAPTSQVQAIQAGATQIRIPVKGMPDWAVKVSPYKTQEIDFMALGLGACPTRHALKAPYSVGDIVAVRETWRTCREWDKFPASEISDMWVRQTFTFPIHYESDYPNDPSKSGVDGKLRSAQSLPLRFVRIRLEITGVRCERVNAISEADARLCGIKVLCLQSADDPSAWWQSAPGVHQGRTARDSFSQLWESLHGKRYPWDTAWVWAFDFKRVDVKP